LSVCLRLRYEISGVMPISSMSLRSSLLLS
jgi:hypothetical protein